MEQFNSGVKFHLRNQFSQVQHWSDERWKSCMAAGGGSKRRYQYCSDNSGTILDLRALQGHSGRNLIDPTGQCYYSAWNIPSHLPPLDVRSIFTLLSTMDWYLEVRIRAEDKR